MLSTFKKMVFAVGAVCCFVPVFLSAAPPPAEVGEVVGEMGKFETNYQAGNWQDAAVSTEKIEKTINTIFVQEQLDDFVLEEALADLKKGVAAENTAEVEVAYTAFQKQYFNFVSHFDHDVHPILVKTERHVMVGMPEALAKKDYKGVLREMNRAGMLIDHGRTVLINKGVPEQEINEFQAKLVALNLAGKKEDYPRMDVIVDELKATYGSFVTKYKGK